LDATPAKFCRLLAGMQDIEATLLALSDQKVEGICTEIQYGYHRTPNLRDRGGMSKEK
jgi:hypothetical protein